MYVWEGEIEVYDSKVYTEVYEIINMLSDKEKAKIPEQWHKIIETNRDKVYEFDARKEKYYEKISTV